MFNTGFIHFWLYQKLQIIITKDIPENYRHYLNTFCMWEVAGFGGMGT